MIADYKNPHGKPTKQLNSIEFLLEQVVKGTYEYGEDKILHATLPKAMIDQALAMYDEEIMQAKQGKAYSKGCLRFESKPDDLSVCKNCDTHINSHIIVNIP